MWDLKQDVNHLEAMLAKQKLGYLPARFLPEEVKSIERVIKVAKLLDELLDFMDRPIPSEKEEE